jgi:hypothetical protein
MTRSRLIALLLAAALVTVLLGFGHVGLHPGGLNDGGYWMAR